MSAASTPLTTAQLQRAATAAKQMAKAELRLVFDASRPGSRPVPEQEEFFRDIGKYQYRWIVAANQASKTSMVIREIAWLCNGEHPYGWTRPPEWGAGPLLILIVTQDRRLGEIELYENKLKPLLANPDEWREVRQGGSLQHIENRRTEDKVVFLSHADSSDRNRKHLQGFVSHYVMCDEMPASVTILEELQRRVDSRRGYFVSSFTPKFRNANIKKIVDSSEAPLAKKYTFSKFINPLFKGREKEELAKLAGHSQDYIDAVLYGKWMSGDGMIYNFNPAIHGGALPDTYSRGWRHVCVVDPANNSQTGFTLWAEDPATATWYLARSRYFEVSVPTELIRQVEAELVGYNVVSRRADSQAAWFRNQAAAMGHKYMAVEDKQANSKEDFIARAQECLASQRVRIPEFNTEMVDELCSYERNPETGQIVKAQKYHLIDCFHYFCHRIPAHDAAAVTQPWWVHLRQADEVRRRDEDRRSRKLTDVRQVEQKIDEVPIGDTSGNPFLRPAPGSRNSPAGRKAEQARRARHRRVWSRRA